MAESNSTSELESSGDASVRGNIQSSNSIAQLDPTAVQDEYSRFVSQVINPSVPPTGGALRQSATSTASAEEANNSQRESAGSVGFIRTFVAEEYVADVESLSSNEGDNLSQSNEAHVLQEKPIELDQGETSEDINETTEEFERQLSITSDTKEKSVLSETSSILLDSDGPDLDTFPSNVFIMSEAAKPIYMRHGPEHRLVSLAGVMQALVSFVEYGGDTIQTIEGDGGVVICFYLPKHLTIVGVVRGHETPIQVRIRLTYMYNQLLTLISPVQLDQLFTRRVNYDLRRSLVGETRILTQLWDWMDSDIGHLLCAACCLPLSPAVRDQLSATLAHYCKKQKVLFGLVLAGLNLVTIVRHNRCPRLNPLDLQLLINLVRSSSQSGVTGAEFWVPVCLPRLDESAYVHAYVSHIDEPSELTLVLISADGNQFYSLCECRRRIVERLSSQGSAMVELKKAAVDGAFPASQFSIPELWHFTFKSRHLSQYTMTRCEVPFAGPEGRKQLMELYRRTHHLLHMETSRTQPRSVVYFSTSNASCLGWLREQFELYAIFSPLVTKEAAVSMTSRLIGIMRQEEPAIFVVSTPTF